MSLKPQIMICEDGSEMLLIHYTYLHEGGLLSPAPTWKIACVPNLMEHYKANGRMLPWLRSDEPRAVNCPGCVKSPEYIKAMDLIKRLT